MEFSSSSHPRIPYIFSLEFRKVQDFQKSLYNSTAKSPKYMKHKKHYISALFITENIEKRPVPTPDPVPDLHPLKISPETFRKSRPTFQTPPNPPTTLDLARQYNIICDRPTVWYHPEAEAFRKP